MAGDERLLVDEREVVITPDMYVRCDGGNVSLGHPVEFITLERGGEAVCKYCGRHYVHAGSAKAAELRARSRPYAA
jgi:uncharacterized Zn-finger protein